MAPSWSGCSSRAWRSEVGRAGPHPFLHQPVGFGGCRGQPADELGHRLLGQGADETVDHLAVPEGEHGGDGLDLKAAGDGRVLVHVDLGQGHRPLGGVDHLLDDGPEGPARTAPGRPQVDHHRELGRSAQDFLFEGGIGDIDHRITIPGATAADRSARRAWNEGRAE